MATANASAIGPPLDPADVPDPDLIIRAPELTESTKNSLTPRSAFWDSNPEGVYVQLDQRLVSAWERVTLAGFELPGVCEVSSPGRIRKVTTYSGPGDEVEELVDLGAQASEVRIVVRVWAPAQLAQWEIFCRYYGQLMAQARQGDDVGDASAPAMEIVHPGLNIAGINSVYITQVSVLAPGAVRGMMEATISGTEYRQKPKRKAAPKDAAAPEEKSQAVRPVSNDLTGLDKLDLDKSLKPKKPSQTEATKP